MFSDPSRAMAIDYKLHAVLFVDDEPQNLVVFRYAMEEHFNVLTAQSGEQALEILARQPIAVLLADQRMPSMGGVELCMRARELQPDAVRIIITAYADIHAAIGAINQGRVSRYLVKPWRNEELIDILQTSIELVHLQQAMREMELRLLHAAPSHIASVVQQELAHEVANPLTSLGITLLEASAMLEDMIQRFDDPAQLAALKAPLLEMRELHGDAFAAIEQLRALVDRVRGLPRALTATQSCDAARVIDATLRIVRRDVERVANLHVVLEGSPTVAIEASVLGQIVLNLTLNAAQAIEAGGVSGRTVRVWLEIRGERAVITITDDGPGIAPGNLSRVFDRHFTTKGTGKGLGLSIVREMVRGAGGQISAHSTPGQETTFEVLLPLAPSA
jgi:signal transduction histidine kinase